MEAVPVVKPICRILGSRCRHRRRRNFYITRISKVAGFVFAGQFKGPRGPRTMGHTVGEVISARGTRRRMRTGGGGERPVVLPEFSYRVFERAFTSEFYRGRAGMGIVRRMVKRTSIDAAVGVCTRTGPRIAERTLRGLTGGVSIF